MTEENSNNQRRQPRRGPPRGRSERSSAPKDGARHRSSRPHGASGGTPKKHPASGRTPHSKGGAGASRKRGGRPSDRSRHAGRPRQSAPKPRDTSNETLKLPPLGDNIRIIPLGGVEEIGKNMTAIEIGNDILVIDVGFQFKEEETPGIDYILPNSLYLEEHKDRVRGVLVTHGHLDHIGGIPYIMDRIGNPPIYTRNLTSIMIQKRQAEFPHVAPLDIRTVEKNDKIKIGELSIRFFGVTHTIPDSMGILIETPYGAIVAPGDYKLTHIDGVPSEEEEEQYKIFDDEKVLCMMLDSTNIEQPGFSTPESLVAEGLEQIIREASGRLIIGTFASQITRLVAAIEVAEKYKKKVVIEGRSMKNNLEIAQLAGLLKVQSGTIIPSNDIDKYPKNKIMVLSTGAQGEEFAALMRMANKSHRNLQIQPGDTVVLSSSIIPGNERAVERLKDNIAKAGGHIVHYRTSEQYIHSSGHGNREELAWLHRKVKPKFFIPVHGNYYRLKLHAELAESVGLKAGHSVVPSNGSVIEIQEKGTKIVVRKEKVPSGIRMVDGFAIGDMQEVVIRDRQMLAEDGMFVVIAMVNLKTGKLKKSPDIISRGFIYLRESQDVLGQTRIIAKKAVEDTTATMNPINFDYVKKNLTESIERFLFQKTAKHPIVIPVILGI